MRRGGFAPQNPNNWRAGVAPVTGHWPPPPGGESRKGTYLRRSPQSVHRTDPSPRFNFAMPGRVLEGLNRLAPPLIEEPPVQALYIGAEGISIDSGASCRLHAMEPTLVDMTDAESQSRVAQPGRGILSVPSDWVHKWEARERELHALFAGGALSPEFVEGVVERTLQQEMAAYLAVCRAELPWWRRTLGI